MITRWLPGLRTLASYRAGWLRSDLVAGLVLTTLLVPQGMAYAELAGLPVITGLYTSVLCLLGYALFGPSRILVLGPDSSLGPMIAATILPIVGASDNPEHAVALASMLALLVGAIMIAAGVAKLGFVADLLSKPTRIGYMNGLALTILVGQLPKLFGFSVSANGLIDEAHAFIHGVASGETVGAAVGVGLVSLGLILVLGRWLPRVPGVLVAVSVCRGCRDSVPDPAGWPVPCATAVGGPPLPAGSFCTLLTLPHQAAHIPLASLRISSEVGLAARPPGSLTGRQRGQQGRTVRLSEFWERMQAQFGDTYASSVAKDHVLAELGGRTVEQALADGEDAKRVWRAVAEEFDVPPSLR